MATDALKSPYPTPSYCATKSSIEVPVKADSMINRFDTPGLFSTSKATIPSESVTALLIFFSISLGVSNKVIVDFFIRI